MACFAPICYLLHRVMADGTDALLMEPDLGEALADSARAELLGAWRTERITLGHETVLEGDALRAAIAQAAAQLPA
jgi:hypothetical protein